MVMQVFRGDDDGDNSSVNPSSPLTDGVQNSQQAGRRWFIDQGHSAGANEGDQNGVSNDGPQFLRFAGRKPVFDFSEPKPA
ncbi:MAG: hypothetical protein ABJZ55_21125 [Fuerstiella sp.]